MVEVEEVHGGTRGTRYMFVIRGKEILHLSQIEGVKCLFREGRRRKRVVIWDVPNETIANCKALWVDYANSGHLGLHLLEVPDVNELERIEKLSYLTLRNYIKIDKTEETLEYIKNSGLIFRELGRERNMCSNYLKYVPKLVKDFWDSMKRIGISEIYMGGGGHRLEEVLKDPDLGYILSMLLPTDQGRVRSLYEKLSKSFELWVFSKIAEVLGEYGKRVNDRECILIEATRNNKVLEFDVDGERYAMFYQPSIAPHVISGFLPEDKLQALKKRLGVKKLHLIPDIVIAENVDDYLNWGEFHKIKDKIRLIVEVKLSLKGTTRYDTIDMAISQIETYSRLLNNAKTLLVILEPNPYAKSKLERELGARVVDDAFNKVDELRNSIEMLLNLKEHEKC